MIRAACQICRLCRFWAPEERGDPAAGGACRREPPRVLATFAWDPQEGLIGRSPLMTETEGVWPRTDPDDWCGQWQDGRSH